MWILFLRELRLKYKMKGINIEAVILLRGYGLVFINV